MSAAPFPQRWWLLIASAVLGLAAGGGWAWYQIRSQQVRSGATTLPSTTAVTVAAAPAGMIPDLGSPAELGALLHAHAGTVLIDVHAQWCEPCAVLAPRLVTLAHDQPQIAIRGVDAGTSSALATQLAVDILPTLIHYEHGVEVDRRSFVPTVTELTAWLARAPPAPTAH